jgi:hypothetical protein
LLPRGRRVLASERSIFRNFFATLDRVARIAPVR